MSNRGNEEDSYVGRMKRKKKKQEKVNLVCWNMRTLVEDDGSIKTGRVRQNEQRRKGSVEKKAVLMVWEMKRYATFAAAISETKWFGNDIYEIENYTILHSGRELPKEGEPVATGEGVGIALSPEATKAWRDGGEQWEPVNSRIVTARMKMKGRKHLSIVSVYAPTFRSPQQDKDDFYTELQRVVDQVPEDDILVVMGDWNARVGSNQGGDDLWDDVRGKHGLGKMNEAGLFLLSFCSAMSLTIMNTCFEKRDIYKRTWQHPGTKQWHCIDYILMRQNQRRRCVDAQVMRGAECWTDHRMVRAKVLVEYNQPRRKQKSEPRGLNHLNMHQLRNEDVSSKFNKTLAKLMEKTWPKCNTTQEKLDTLTTNMKSAALEVLPTKGRRTPDWFLENEHVIRPDLDKRDQLKTTWLSSKSTADKERYLKQKSTVQRLIRQIKNEWFQAKAAEIEQLVSRSKSAWKSIGQLQQASGGLRPSVPRITKDENGEVCKTPAECQNRWKRHFESVLNIESSFDMNVIEAVKQRPLHMELELPPSEEEVQKAFGALKCGKASGKNGLTPELVKHVGRGFADHIQELFKAVWVEGRVPKEWVDAVIVAIPKKGDLSVCDNWRGISLLDVMGKVFARILQQRLQAVAEGELAESQCGFRKGRGCTDMVFCARQLVEKAIEHEELLYVVFVDLRKAYDSVPRTAMWRILEKYGFPPVMVSLIRSFHDGMSAELRINGQALGGEISVSNGLRQGCTMAPALFNMFFNLVVETWREQCMEDGITILYKADGRLVGSRSSKHNTVKVNELQFADDIAILAETKEKIVHAMSKLFEITSQWGLTISVPKTKVLVVGSTGEEEHALQIGDVQLEIVEEFKYLGSVIHHNGSIQSDTQGRVAMASRAFGRLRKSIFQNKSLTTLTKRVVYKAVVLGTLLYGSETWTTKRIPTQKLETFHNRCLRGIFAITRLQQRTERISSSQVREMFGMREMVEEMVILRRMQWLGHVARMPEHRLPKQILFGRLPKARPFHGVKLRWKDRVMKDMVSLNVGSMWYRNAQDRKEWYDAYRAGMEEKIEKRLCKEEAQRQAKRQTALQTNIPTVTPFTCEQCQRTFRRSGDLKRHKCKSRNRNRQRENSSEPTYFQCQKCSREFRRQGDMKRHKCKTVK